MRFRLAAAAVWLTLVIVAVVASPPSDPGTGELVRKMLTGQLEGVNLSFFALFNVMGVWPMALASLLANDPKWKWPFVLGSFALGAFVLGPWMVLRSWAPQPAVESVVARVLRSTGLRVVLAVAALGLAGLFFFGGDLPAFLALWPTNQFAFVMSFDFVACTLFAGLLLLSARGTPSPQR
jgi:hypothetical protein